MASNVGSAPVTILFTALVDSAELLRRAGDERAQRIFGAHHRLLQEIVTRRGGRTVKRLDDGLMVAFPSAVDAVHCAIALQQAAREPVHGEHLQIRVGINVGEAFHDESDYFGTPVVVARRLCDISEAGQILCSTLLAGLLSGRQAVTFADRGELQLKGITEPVATSEVIYTAEGPPLPSGEPIAPDLPATHEPAAPVTILYTDLVDSTKLLQRAGDEAAQRIFHAHHELLRDAVSVNGGHEVKWLGDGLMVAFPSAADAVRCAISMQQAARRPVAGERLEIRVGLNVGEPLREESDYFGTPVVVARELCDRAVGGQILCSSLVAGLLAGRQAFTFEERGELQAPGIAGAVITSEVRYSAHEPAALLGNPPFIGRDEELRTLERRLPEARAGHGALVLLAGEPEDLTPAALQSVENLMFRGV